MVLRCLTCGAHNPATNLYCGQCGANLHRAAVDASEHGHPPSEGEPDVDARAKEEAERKKRTEIARWKEIELEGRGIFMPWNLKDPASDPARDAARGRAPSEPASEAHASQPADRHSDGTVDARVEAPKPVATTISPVPALTNDGGGGYAAESHSKRNLALAMLAAVVILAAVQWRSIRDHALDYLQKGSEQVSRQDVPPVGPPAAAAENTNPPVKEPAAANRRDGRNGPGVASASGGDSPAPGAAEMYQAAHASDAILRAAWLWRAVRAGNPQATIELAKMYEAGDGVAQSCDQARLLLQAAAAKGNARRSSNSSNFH